MGKQNCLWTERGGCSGCDDPEMFQSILEFAEKVLLLETEAIVRIESLTICYHHDYRTPDAALVERESVM